MNDSCITKCRENALITSQKKNSLCWPYLFLSTFAPVPSPAPPGWDKYKPKMAVALETSLKLGTHVAAQDVLWVVEQT